MIRSLRTGITGLKSHQTRMDVIGNNIANVNTVSFKRSRATFKEMLGQQNLGSGAVKSRGVNSTFIGFGVRVGGISQNWQQGSLESTNLATDLALDGDGFFMVKGAHQNLLTRDGSFQFNESGKLVTTNQLPVLGYPINEGEVDTSHIEEVGLDWGALAPPKFTESSTVDGNLNSETEAGEVVTLSRQVFDEQGEAHNLMITLTKTANANEWDYDAAYDGDVAPPPFSSQSGTLTFSPEGVLDPPPAISLDWDANIVTGGPSIDVNLDNITQYSGSNTITIREQDGYTFGRLLGYNIDDRGVVSLSFSNGEIENISQLAIATVDNPNGLNNTGENFYLKTAESGELHLGRSGHEHATSIVSGSLEMSNVDLAQEFTDMIIAQRGYQASARVITTSDEILQETVSLKR